MTEAPAQSGPDLSGVTWHVGAPAFDPCSGLAGVSWVLVKKNRRRTVYRGTVGATGFFLKHDHPCRAIDRLASRLWRCKAEQEFRAGQALAGAGVPCVCFLAWGERGSDSFLLSREISPSTAYLDAWETCGGDPDRRRSFLTDLVAFIGLLARVGVRHPDLHVGNVLVTFDGEHVAFHLLDVCGTRLGVRTAPGHHGSPLRLAFRLGRALQPEEGAQILAEICLDGKAGTDNQAAWRRHVHDFFRRNRKQWAGRQERLLNASSLCEYHTGPEGVWRVRRPFALELARQAVKQHADNIGRDNTIKTESKRRLSRVHLDNLSLIVKEYYRIPSPALAWTRPDRGAWLNAYRLELAGIPTARQVAWLQAPDARGYIVCEDLGPRTLLQRLQERPAAAERLRLLQAAGHLIAWLHGCGLAPADCTAANIMLTSAPAAARMPLAVIDVDRILAYAGDVPWPRRIRNLAQLLELVREVAEGEECAELLRVYGQEAVLSPEQTRRLMDVLLQVRRD